MSGKRKRNTRYGGRKTRERHEMHGEGATLKNNGTDDEDQGDR